MPDWTGLVAGLVDDLYPEADATLKEHREKALSAASAPGAMTRLAEEHATAFGRPLLDRRLQELVPDEAFEPGPLHVRLLELPWRDVFTTNWDTLLERTRARVAAELGFQVVAAPFDLPRSAQPRIVKLHGSFPYTRPFVVTEEDYRTYPEASAPFVNTVRQAAMENVLCLIGFSGDDPNFLAWTGWVRDQLSEHRPHIYLVGMDRHSSAQRMLLERRGIRLIDLGRLDGLDRVPGERRHAIALDWFLSNLAAGRPSAHHLQWPDPPTLEGAEVRPGLPKIPPGPEPGWAVEPRDAVLWSEWTADRLSEFVAAWRANRLAYPGWVVAPAAVRDRLWRRTTICIDGALQAMARATLLVRVLALRELAFRLDVCSASMPDALAAALAETLGAVASRVEGVGHGEAHPDAHTVGVALAPAGGDEDENGLWRGAADAGSAWLELVFASLRHQRETGEWPAFEVSARPAAAFRPVEPQVLPRLCHERCLAALSRLDHQRFERALEMWGDADGGDPFWRVRKAALLAETGRVALARNLCGRALDEIRRSRRTGAEDVASLSREAWAFMLAQILDMVRLEGDEPKDVGRLGGEADRRWRELASLVGHPWDELEKVEIRLDAPPPRFGSRTEREQDFDGRRSETVSVASGSEWTAARYASQAIRIADDAGLPPSVGDVSVTRRLRSKAMGVLEDHAPAAAGVAYIRNGRIEEREKSGSPLSRVWVARLGSEEASGLTTRAERELDIALASYRVARDAAGAQAGYWLRRAGFLLELLSRLVLRVPSDQARGMFGRAVSHYGDALFKHRLLQRPFTKLFSRAVEALSPADRADRLVEAMSLLLNDLPFPHSDWPSIGRLFHEGRTPTGRPAPPERLAGMDAAVMRLLEALAKDDGPARRDAIERLDALHGRGSLSAGDMRAFANGLWRPLRRTGLPSNEEVTDCFLLVLPQPEDRLAEQAFRRAYLSREALDPFAVPDAMRDSRRFHELVGRLKAVSYAGHPAAATGALPITVDAGAAALLTERLIACIARFESAKGDRFTALDRTGLIRLALGALATTAIPNLADDDVASL